MSMTLVTDSDPIIALEDAMSLLSITDDTVGKMIVNSLSEKFRLFTERVQLNQDVSVDIVEHLRGDTPNILYLHCAPVHIASDVKVEIFDGHNVVSTYLYSDEDIACYSDNYEARLESAGGIFPVFGDCYIARVTYRGGWAAIPGNVTEGAILQGRVDLNRYEGEVGVTQRSSGDESTTFDVRGIIRTVQELWAPYRVIV